MGRKEDQIWLFQKKIECYLIETQQGTHKLRSNLDAKKPAKWPFSTGN